jgi:hypothetical protein
LRSGIPEKEGMTFHFHALMGLRVFSLSLREKLFLKNFSCRSDRKDSRRPLVPAGTADIIKAKRPSPT